MQSSPSIPGRRGRRCAQFQLATPQEYVLLLVQAATLKGASRLEFEIDADDMHFSFDGEPFTRDDLEQVFSSLFTRADTLDVRARRELALGLNAAMALNPKFISVITENGQEGVRLEIRPNEKDDMSSFASTESGTKIHVKERFRPGLLLKFYQKLRGMMVEEVLIRERCQYARTSILLAEEEIARGLHLPRGAVGMVPIAGPEISGLAWHVPHSKHSAATLVSNGVSIVELPMDHGPPVFHRRRRRSSPAKGCLSKQLRPGRGLSGSSRCHRGRAGRPRLLRLQRWQADSWFRLPPRCGRYRR